MSETNLSAEFEKTYRTTAGVLVVQIVAALVLTAVALLLITYSSNDISDAAYTILWAAVLFVALGTFVLRRMLFSWERLKNVALLKGANGLLKNLQTYTILLGSLGETVAVIGFLIGVLSGNKIEMLRAGAIALIIFAINFPRKANWRKVMAAAEKLNAA